jgi:hypothetical protein
MGIEVHQIHNLVRTYQRALQPATPAKSTEPVNHQDDRVSVSAEARERHESESVKAAHDRDNKKRTR